MLAPCKRFSCHHGTTQTNARMESSGKSRLTAVISGVGVLVAAAPPASTVAMFCTRQAASTWAMALAGDANAGLDHSCGRSCCQCVCSVCQSVQDQWGRAWLRVGRTGRPYAGPQVRGCVLTCLSHASSASHSAIAASSEPACIAK